MKKIIEIIIEDFECVWCGHKEYFVTDPYSKKRKIFCDKCGRENHVDYKVVKEWEIPKYTTAGLNEEERLDAEETLVAIGLLVCVLVFLFIMFVLFCLF